jgi:DNA-binding transcriptional LysR family regulator
MAKAIDWDSRIGRRIRLRDLHILFAVVQHGSMAKAGASLGMSQSAVSQAIAALEHALDAPVLDRTPRGVELTIYGTALMRRGQVAFDELRSGVKDIECLADPELGEVRIGCTETMAAGILPAVIERFSLRYPKVKLSVLPVNTFVRAFAELQERTVDISLTLSTSSLQRGAVEHLQAEVLFYDQICLAVAMQSAWARRRKIGLADLVDVPLLSPPLDSEGPTAVAEAFRAAGLPMPQVTVTTFSVHVRNVLTMSGRFIAVLPVSILQFDPGRYSLKELPLDLPMPRWPALMATLKDRTLSPAVERFMACARDVAKAMQAPARKSA